MKHHDIIIVGGGPAGSTLAALLAKKNIDVAVFEREEFPRFHIGESLLPASMPILKEIGFYSALDSGKYIRKYGARFVDYTTTDEIYFGFDGGLNPDIPMAFEVPRGEFDRDLLAHAAKCGAFVYQPERVKEVEFGDKRVEVKTNRNEFECKYLIDGSGRDSFLGKKFNVRSVHPDLNNVAVFAHFVGVKRMEGRREGDIIIGLLPNQSWSWIIPFQGERTSVGVVCNSRHFEPQTDLAAYMNERLSQSAQLKDIMSGAERVTEMSAISNYSHGCSKHAGERWMLIGDAAAFLDPIFSNGVHIGLMSAKLASEVILKVLDKDLPFTIDSLGERYQKDLSRGIDRFHALVSLFYRSNFVEGMKKTLERPNMRQAFTSAVAGDMWNDQNILFQMDVL